MSLGRFTFQHMALMKGSHPITWLNVQSYHAGEVPSALGAEGMTRAEGSYERFWDVGWAKKLENEIKSEVQTVPRCSECSFFDTISVSRIQSECKYRLYNLASSIANSTSILWPIERFTAIYHQSFRLSAYQHRLCILKILSKIQTVNNFVNYR